MAKELEHLTDKEKSALNKSEKFFNFSEHSEQRVEFIERYEDNYENYLMYKKDREYALKKAKQDWRSNLFVPLTYSHVETLIPNLVMNIVNADPIVVLKPNERRDIKPAKIAEKLCQIQAMEMGYPEKFEEWTRDAAVGGTAVGVVSWKHEEKTVPKPVRGIREISIGGMNIPIPKIIIKSKKEKVVTYDAPDFEIVDPHDYYPDVNYSRIEDMRACGREIILTMKEIKQLYDNKVFKNKDVIDAIEKDEAITVNITREEERRLQQKESDSGLPKDMQRYLIREYMEDNRLIYTLNKKYVLRDTANPNWHKKKHFVDAKIVTVPHEYYGRGIPWTIADIQSAMNDLYNHRADNLKYILNNMVEVVESKLKTDTDLRPRPGGLIRVKQQGAYNPVRMHDLTQDAYREQGDLQNMAQNSDGIFDIVQGKMNRKETATVGRQLARAAGIRLRNHIWRIATTGVKKTWMLMVELNRQYLKTDRMIEMVGIDKALDIPRFIDVNRVDMPSGKLNFVPKVALEQEKDIERNWMMKYYSMMYGKPEVDSYTLTQALADTMPFNTRHDIMASDEEYKKKMQKLGGIIPDEMKRPVAPGVMQNKPPTVPQRSDTMAGDSDLT